MKTRIISAAVGIAVFFAAVFAAIKINGIILDVLLMIVGAVGVYEALVPTKYLKSKFITVCSIVYAVVTPFACSGYIPVDPEAFTVLLGMMVFASAMFMHRTVKPFEAAYAFAMTVVVTYCFWSMAAVFNSKDGHGLFYLLLVFVAAWTCDTGAYFSGYFFGKHKMAPEISPKKTVEGAVGGVIFAAVCMWVSCIIFKAVTGQTANALLLVAVSPLLSVAGMIGDLIASYIKRDCGIKDYGNIMPGHGGILDRFDSVMTVVPILYLIVSHFNVVI